MGKVQNFSLLVNSMNINRDLIASRTNLVRIEALRGFMPCKSCSSANQSKFNGEIGIHFPGLKNIDKSVVWVFPALDVCMDCGTAEFAVPEAELLELAKGDATVGHSTRLKEGPVNNPVVYSWQTAYVSAILETNKSQLIGRIAEARQAIELRLVNPIQIDCPEHLAIKEAWKGLLALKAERVDGSV